MVFKPPGFSKLMKKAQEMKDKMSAMQKEIAAMEVTGTSGAGLVKVVINGQHYAKSIAIADSLLQEEKSILEDLIVAAINDATDKIEGATKEKMGGLSDFQLPEGFDLPTE